VRGKLRGHKIPYPTQANLPHNPPAMTGRVSERSERSEMSWRRSVRMSAFGVVETEGSGAVGSSAHEPETGPGAKLPDIPTGMRAVGPCTTPRSLPGVNDRKTGRVSRAGPRAGGGRYKK
jgi:hypothetical protein